MGGTFNPIHNGHMQMIENAIEYFGLDDVVVIPSGIPPHKNEEILSPYRRYEMCLLAAAGYDNIFVSSLEIERSGFTYTIDTLKELEIHYGIKDNIYFIIGGDTVFELENWKNFKQVFKKCSFIAFGRTGSDHVEIMKKIEFLKRAYKAKISIIPREIEDISSTGIRKLVREGKSFKGLVPKRVGEYILKRDLYKD